MKRRLGAVLIACLLSTNFAAAQPRDFRSVEIAVELAWMNDPITFAYELHAQFKNGYLEVQGPVPDLAVRKQALNIARLYGSKQVFDQTDIIPGCAKASVSVPGSHVVAAAQARLARTLPQLAPSVRVLCDDEGRVTLEGAASTLAEKLTLSEMMRRVPGCSRVENCVRVGQAPPPAAIQQVGFQIPIVQAPAVNGFTDQMVRRLGVLCPHVAGIQIRQVAANRFHMQFQAANDADAQRAVAAIFQNDEWKAFRLDIDAIVPR
ncbi:MAG: BON domain-containing protein [Planctomycetota bacterium]